MTSRLIEFKLQCISFNAKHINTAVKVLDMYSWSTLFESQLATAYRD